MKIILTFKYYAIISLAIICINTEIRANSDPTTDKTKAEIDILIEKTGSTAPDWWDSVELGIPETLDMNWPVRAVLSQGRGGFGGRGGRGGGGRGGRGGFWMQGGPVVNQDNSRSIDQYLIQVIYPNASQYTTGIKLVNHLMIINKEDRQKLIRSLNTLGELFYDLLGDYARAAFWWQKSAKMGGSIDSLKLAHCYYELGSKSAAYEVLSTVNRGYRSSGREAIKFWANIGEVDMALEMIESNNQTNMGGRNSGFSRGGSQGVDYMLAAEICRTDGRYEQAIGYYEKVIASMSNNFNNFRSRGGSSSDRAKANMEVVNLLNNLDIKQVPDGIYTSNAIGYGGILYVNVSVARGRIVSVEVTQHRETYSYFYRAIQTARKIISKQGFKGVDTVSGATITSDAIINAAAKALANASE
ncbi:MAG: FMN-binding protein [Sedimentisphaerales bacterium]|nr:FMN-binding protein [Sedimentisphaerales bacterium]